MGAKHGHVALGTTAANSLAGLTLGTGLVSALQQVLLGETTPEQAAEAIATGLREAAGC